MSLPIKIAIGTLGSGTVAVSGYEVVSYATGKDGLFISGASKDAPSNSPQEASESQDTFDSSKEQSTKDQITTLLKELKKGCEIKVKETPEREIDVNSEENLSGLLVVLKAIDGSCKNEKNTDKEKIILKKTDSSWEKISEKDQILELTKDTTSFKCEIKIKTSDNKLKTLSDASDTELSGFLKKLKEIEEDCKKETVSEKKRFFENKEQGGWTKLSEKEKVDYWKTQKTKFSSSGQCTLKIFKDYESKDIETDNEISGLYDFLEESSTGKQVEDSCTEGSTDNRQEVVLQKNNTNGWKVMTERDQIVEFLKDTANFKCTIKIKDGNDGQEIDISNQTQEEKVKGLLKKLKELKTSPTECKGDPAKVLVLQRDSAKNNWNVYPTVDQVNQLKALLTKCTIKIQSKDGTDKTIDSSLSSTSLKNLFDKLSGAKSECTGDAADPKKTVTFKEEASDSWTKTP